MSSKVNETLWKFCITQGEEKIAKLDFLDRVRDETKEGFKYILRDSSEYNDGYIFVWDHNYIIVLWVGVDRLTPDLVAQITNTFPSELVVSVIDGAELSWNVGRATQSDPLFPQKAEYLHLDKGSNVNLKNLCESILTLLENDRKMATWNELENVLTQAESDEIGETTEKKE